MNQVFLHLGLQKTGTTWLQKEIFSKMPGVQYIHDFSIRTILENDKKIIISNEDLCGKPYPEHSGEREQILTHLSHMFPDAKIIIGFRDKDTWKHSMYKQYIKNGGVGSYEDWVQNEFIPGFLDYDAYLSLIHSLFSEVFVYYFENLKHNKEHIVKELCEFIGEPVPEYDDVVVNRSFSDMKTKVMGLLNIIFHSPKGTFRWSLGYYLRFAIKKLSGSWQ